eukprot:Plantae.Rhodophyta-Purpureofilum_apyrenoidigerum.ctg12292.p1 GENE.Plantae.Rhodophyta-Purpureofilum_apyrenoidigerum.ctg12292~~Plantae.Rhodophyta-Purpureofilum_apyrenoidigerum.ctg12292.p1  ORF type:complete len:329 (+),score=61.30 Plantae.Rhodophyta-Purpureofilum_apyrenoidigerum.ctg12292:336-1322(+)
MPVRDGEEDSFESSREKALELYEADKLFQAHRVLAALQKTQPDAFERRAADDKEFNDIWQQCTEAVRILEEMGVGDGWTLSYQGHGKTVWYKPWPGTDFHCLKAEAILEADMLSLLSIVYETDFHSEIFSFIDDLNEIKRLRYSRKIIHSLYKTPWPMKNRESLLFGYAVNGFDEDDCLLVCFRDADTKRDAFEQPSPFTDTVKMSVSIAGLLFEPISATRTRVVNIASVDPCVAAVPTTLINWVARAIFRATLQVLEEKSREIHNLPHAERMRTDPVYIELRAILKKYSELKNWEVDSRLESPSESVRERPKPPSRRFFSRASQHLS